MVFCTHFLSPSTALSSSWLRGPRARTQAREGRGGQAPEGHGVHLGPFIAGGRLRALDWLTLYKVCFETVIHDLAKRADSPLHPCQNGAGMRGVGARTRPWSSRGGARGTPCARSSSPSARTCAAGGSAPRSCSCPRNRFPCVQLKAGKSMQTVTYSLGSLPVQ